MVEPLTSVASPCPLCATPGPHPELMELRHRNPFNPRSVACHVKVVRCDRCGTLRLDPRPDDESLERLQARMLGDSEVEVGTFEAGNTNPLYPRFLAGKLRAAGFPSGGGRLLDIGCGSGDLLAAVAAEVGAAGTGLELAENSLRRARSRFPDLRWVHGRVESGRFPPGSFDGITLIHVLEHITEPLAALREIVSWLSPGGVLVVEVPNGEFYFTRTYSVLFESPKPLLARWYRARGRDVPFTSRAVFPYHVTLFGEESLAAMIRKVGLHLPAGVLAAPEPPRAQLAALGGQPLQAGPGAPRPGRQPAPGGPAAGGSPGRSGGGIVSAMTRPMSVAAALGLLAAACAEPDPLADRLAARAAHPFAVQSFNARAGGSIFVEIEVRSSRGPVLSTLTVDVRQHDAEGLILATGRVSLDLSAMDATGVTRAYATVPSAGDAVEALSAVVDYAPPAADYPLYPEIAEVTGG